MTSTLLLPAAGALVAGYLVGTLPVAWLVVRQASGRDLRNVGTGRLHILDTAAAAGVRLAGVASALELLKGVAVGLGASEWSHHAWGTTRGWFVAAAIAGCVLGDAFPLLLRRGRRGILPLLAGLLVALPLVLVVTLAVALPIYALSVGHRRAFEAVVAVAVPVGLVAGTAGDWATLPFAALMVGALVAGRRRRLGERRMLREHRLQLRRRATVIDLPPPQQL